MCLESGTDQCYFYALDISYLQSSTKSELLKEDTSDDYPSISLEGDCC